MSSPPEFQSNTNTSIVNGGDDAQWAPPPEFEGRKNTSYTSYSQQQRTIQGMIEEVVARPPDYQTKATNSLSASVEDRLIYHPSHRHPLAATLEPLLSKCNACGNEHKVAGYVKVVLIAVQTPGFINVKNADTMHIFLVRHQEVQETDWQRTMEQLQQELAKLTETIMAMNTKIQALENRDHAGRMNASG
nr:zinc finger, PHD-type [Tanacetum cinerariifolium]